MLLLDTLQASRPSRARGLKLSRTLDEINYRLIRVHHGRVD